MRLNEIINIKQTLNLFFIKTSYNKSFGIFYQVDTWVLVPAEVPIDVHISEKNLTKTFGENALKDHFSSFQNGADAGSRYLSTIEIRRFQVRHKRHSEVTK